MTLVDRWVPVLDGQPRPEMGARPAEAGEVPRGAERVRGRAEAGGWRVVATYARGWDEFRVRCEGGLAIWGEATQEGGEGWRCPSCGRPGTMTRFGAIRTHWTGQRTWVTLESLALRMRHPDGRRAVAVWHDASFSSAYVLVPRLVKILLAPLVEFLESSR